MATKKRSIALTAPKLLWDQAVIVGGQEEEPAPEPAAPAQPSGVMRRVLGDGGISLLKGAIAVPEAAVGLADIATGGRVGRFLENEGGDVGFRPAEARKILDQALTPEQQAANRAVQEADGFTGKLGAAVTNPSTVATTVVESLPLMLGGAGVARGLMAAAPRMGAVVAGAAGEGITGAGSAAEQIRQETADGLLTAKQAGLAAASGAATGALAVLGGKVAQRLGIGDVDTLLAQAMTGKGIQQVAAQQNSKRLVRKVLEGAVSEGALEELPQSIQEQVLQNAALNKPLDEGVDYAAVMGLLSGAAMGGAAAPLAKPGDALRQDKLPEVGPMTRSVNAAVEAAAQKVDAGAPIPPAPGAQPAGPDDASRAAAQAGVTAMQDEARRKADQDAGGEELLQQQIDAANAAAQEAAAPEAPIEPATQPPASARAQREADKPAEPTGEVQPGDILNNLGRPFKSMDVAMRRLAAAGGEDTHTIEPVRGGLVVRPKAGAAPVSQPEPQTPAATQEAPSQAKPETPAGRTFDMDGKPWRLESRTDRALVVLDDQGGKRTVAVGSKLAKKIEAAMASTGEGAPAAATDQKGATDGERQEGRRQEVLTPGADAAPSVPAQAGESTAEAREQRISPPANPQQAIDAVEPEPRTVTVAGERVALTPEQAAEWDKTEADFKAKFEDAKQAFERATKNGKPDDPDVGYRNPQEQYDATRKALGMQLSAERRRIAGKQTPKEKAAADQLAARVRKGDTVDTPEGTGEVTGTAFGKVRVQIGDRTVTVAHADAKKVDKAPTAEKAIATKNAESAAANPVAESPSPRDRDSGDGAVARTLEGSGTAPTKNAGDPVQAPSGSAAEAPVSSAPQPETASTARPTELIELRKREAVLQRLMECLG